MKITKAIVLAGGFGTRLKSVVSEVPKPLAPINGRPFLSFLLDELEKQGISEVVLAVGYMGDLVENSLGAQHGSLKLHYSYETEPLGTGGAVHQAISHFQDEQAVWIVNGDTFFNCPFSAVAKTHFDRFADVTLALCEMQIADRYGLVEIADSGRIEQFHEKRKGASGFINAGIYLLNPKTLLNFAFEKRFSLEKDFFEAKIDQVHLQGSPQSGYFVDIGIPEDYEKAKAYFTEKN